MSTFTAFWVGCLVGAVVGVMALSFVVVARDAEERQQRINERGKEYENGKEELHR